MTIVVAVDPGGVCGVAIGFFGGARGNPNIESRELEPMLALDEVSSWLQEGASLVVCENFTPRPGIKTWQPDALHVIGALKYLCYLSDTPFLLQMPGDAKSFATDTKLKKLDWYRPTKDGHANDALRHLLVAAVNGNLIDPEKLLAD